MDRAETHSGDTIELHIPDDTEGNAPHVVWYGLCGYSSVELHFTTPEAAQKFFEAAQEIIGVVED